LLIETTFAKQPIHTHRSARKKKETVPLFILDARSTPKYFRSDVAHVPEGFPDIQQDKTAIENCGLFEGFVTERLRQGNTCAPKSSISTTKASLWCTASNAAWQKLLPTIGQRWQHRAFFAHSRRTESPALSSAAPLSAVLPPCDYALLQTGQASRSAAAIRNERSLPMRTPHG
jgi:hypothetical protein